jgi:hypothetical protein
MKSKFPMCVRALLLIVLLSAVGLAQAQIFVPPVELYRFRVSNTNLGYMLTPYYSEGVNNGYAYEGPVGFIYIPSVSGAVPVNSGLLPVHKWRVVQNGRVYFRYSMAYTSQGSGYTYQGILGYMYAPSLNSVTLQTPLGTDTYSIYKVRSCYSQSYGYYHGKLWPPGIIGVPPYYTFEMPPTSSFDCSAIHGIVGGGIYTTRGTRPGSQVLVSESSPGSFAPEEDPNITPGEWFTEPPPPPVCDPDQENYCWMYGGTWDSSSCSCMY